MLEENNNVIVEGGFNKVLAKTFLWMFMGLLATGIISFYTYSSGMIINLLQSESSFMIICLVELIVVVVFSLLVKKLPPTIVAILFFVYAIINGITLSVIFVVFQVGSIVTIFFAAAAIFGLFAFLGYKTKIDLSKIGTICFAGLICGIVLSIVNMIFFHSSLVSIGIDWLILLVFFGITAYDIQKIKKMNEMKAMPDDRLYIYCAMQIYLDFINIFVRMLSIFGKRR